MHAPERLDPPLSGFHVRDADVPARGIVTMVGLVSAASFVMVGICAVAVGQLLDPLMREFGWGSGAVSGIATTYSLSCMLSGPFAGLAIDRYGSRSMMAAGIALTAAGFALLPLCRSLAAFYAVFVLIGIGYGSVFFLSSTTLIARAAGSRKNLAMGVVMGAGSLGAAAFSVVIGRAVEGYGWRPAALAGASLMLAVLPFVLIAKTPDAARPARRLRTNVSFTTPTMRALATPSFALIAAASALASLGMTGIYFHAIPIFLRAGYTNAAASAVLGASWVLSALGSLAGGAAAQRLGTHTMLAASLALGAVGTTALGFLRGGTAGIFCVALFILLWGATANAVNQFVPILLAERFGTVHLGALTGVQGALMGVIGSAAPLVAGTLYDAYGSYRLSILASTGVTVAALALILMLPPAGAHRIPKGSANE